MYEFPVIPHLHFYTIAPAVDHARVFEDHPEVEEWYHAYICMPLEDIRRMEMHRTSDDAVHIWVYLHSMPDAVGYRRFSEGADGRFVPSPALWLKDTGKGEGESKG